MRLIYITACAEIGIGPKGGPEGSAEEGPQTVLSESYDIFSVSRKKKKYIIIIIIGDTNTITNRGPRRVGESAFSLFFFFLTIPARVPSICHHDVATSTKPYTSVCIHYVCREKITYFFYRFYRLCE